MEKRLFVGELPVNMDEDGLRAEFSEHGTVAGAEVIRDRETGESKGSGFVEMETEEDAEKALAAMNGKDVQGKQLKVSEAQPRGKRDLPPPKPMKPW